MKSIDLIKSENGSTLSYLMVLMAILMMLGVAIMTTTYAGYMLKISEAHDQTALYVSEAGLNEAYTYLGEEVENAVQYSRNVYIPAQLLNHPEVAKLSKQESDFKTAVQGYFKRGYKSYFIMNEDQILKRLEEQLLLSPNTSYGPTGESVAKVEASLLHNFSDTLDQMALEFQTTVSKTDGLSQKTLGTSTIKAVLQVSVPDYDVPIARQAKVIKKNALLDHALAANGNLYVQGGKVTINGNATLVGHNGKYGIQVPGEAGGIVVGSIPKLWDSELNSLGAVEAATDQSGQLLVTGNLITSKFLRIAKSTSESPSKVEVIGNFYGNSIALQGLTNEGASIKIQGYASVFDDLELEARNSSVDIEGSYYGFSAGNAGGTGVSVHDNSSSIVINNFDFGYYGDLSRISIKGQNGISFPADKTTGIAPNSPEDGTYLAGTIYTDEGKTFILKEGEGLSSGQVKVLANGTYLYKRSSAVAGALTDQFKVNVYYEGTFVEEKTVDISLGEDEDQRYGYVQNSYQTGDSISIHGNYVAYSKVLDSKNAINTGDDPVDLAYLDLDELTYFEDFEPLFVVNKKKNLANLDEPLPMTYVDKEKYSYFSQRQEPGDLNLGNGRIDLGKVVYSTGTYLDPSGMKHRAGDLSMQSLILDHLGKDFNHKVDGFGDPQHEDYINEQDNLIKGGVEAWLKDGTPDILSGTNNELFYIQPKDNKKSVILKGIGDDAVLTSLKTQLGADQYVVMDCSNPVKGMIVSNGNLFILGTVQYEGLLVAKGSVYCLGAGEKTLTNTLTSQPENYVTRLALDGINASLGVAPKKIGYWFRQEPEWKEVIVDNRYIAEVGGIYKGSVNTFDRLIKITHWEKGH